MNFALNTGYTEDQANQVAHILNQVLANTFVLAVKTKNYHWHVKGMQFSSLHTLFDSQNEGLVENLDTIAERIRAFDRTSLGTLTEFLDAASIKETPAELPNAEGMLIQLLADHEWIIRELKNQIGILSDISDPGSADMLTSFLEGHEKMAWMLRAHLQQ